LQTFRLALSHDNRFFALRSSNHFRLNLSLGPSSTSAYHRACLFLPVDISSCRALYRLLHVIFRWMKWCQVVVDLSAFTIDPITFFPFAPSRFLNRSFFDLVCKGALFFWTFHRMVLTSLRLHPTFPPFPFFLPLLGRIFPGFPRDGCFHFFYLISLSSPQLQENSKCDIVAPFPPPSLFSLFIVPTIQGTISPSGRAPTVLPYFLTLSLSYL